MRYIDNQFDEVYWERLSSAIKLGYVVPVIGANAIFTDKEKTISQTIFEKFCEISESSSDHCFSDYDEYLYSCDNIQMVHSNYKNALEAITQGDIKRQIVKNSKELLDFLSLKKFPIIIYCSPDMQINVLLEEIWKDRYDVNSIANFINMKDFLFTPYDGKNLKELDYKKKKNKITPFVVHMMGKADNLSLSRAFAITEDDKLYYIRKLLNPRNMPAKLTQALNNKIFLFIGCDFPDWQFRFLCNALMQEFSTKDIFTDGFRNTMVEDSNDHNNRVRGFDYFLDTINTSLCTDHSKLFLGELVSKYNTYIARDRYNRPQHIDVFISYCWEDRDIAVELANALNLHGIDVWLDKKSEHIDDRNQLVHGGDFDNAIKEAISNASFFIPIITKRIQNALPSRYVFSEWKYAINNNTKKRKQNPERGSIVPCYIGVDSNNYTIQDKYLLEQLNDIALQSHNGHWTSQVKMDGVSEFETLKITNDELKDLKENFCNIIEMVKVYG